MRIKINITIYLLLSLSIFIKIDLVAQIPTISIQTEEEIVDEPKVPGTFTYTDTDGNIISSNIGIEIRGGFSQTYPKKTYDIEFWNDDSGSTTIDVQFGDLREDDDWILDAMYNEPLRINSFLSHKLWLDINQLYYKTQEPKAKSGADVMYVKVTINDEYHGIYLLSEQVDRSQLKLKKNTTTAIRGELYKAYTWDDAVLFNNPSETPNNNSLSWSGYEIRYPKNIVDWSNLEELVDFVANSTNEVFVAGIEGRFDMDNLMDYFIFLNLARLLDNRGKNIYLCRYDAAEPYFLTPWDLDGSWGLLWNGTNDTHTDDILSNNLFDRIITNDVNSFRQKVSDRWINLRQSLISDNALENRINTAHHFLLDHDIYTKEGEVWDYEYAESNLDYMFDWLGDRLAYLDDYFKNITSVTKIKNAQNLVVFPNPTQDFIFISGEFNPKTPVFIYNILGKVERKDSIHSNNNKIYVGDLPSGMYVLQIETSRTLLYKD